MPNHEAAYLGDGLYAKDTDYDVQLFCDREENGRNWVALEPDTLMAFFRFVEKVRNVKITIERKDDEAGS